MNLQEFLNKTNVTSIEEEVAISQRLKNPETGELFKFKIRPLTDKEWESARSEATTLPKKAKERSKFNNSYFNDRVVLAATIYPNFKDAESIQSLGCISPEQYLHKVLLPGEIAELSTRIVQLSGFTEDIDELIEESKN